MQELIQIKIIHYEFSTLPKNDQKKNLHFYSETNFKVRVRHETHKAYLLINLNEIFLKVDFNFLNHLFLNFQLLVVKFFITKKLTGCNKIILKFNNLSAQVNLLYSI